MGVADTNHWGQVFLSPTAYGIVEVEDPDGHARDWGVKVLSRLSQATAITPKSLKATQDIAIKAMEEKAVSLILLVPVGATLYVVTLGQGKVLLKRTDHLATLMEGPGAISGEVKEGDTLVLLSRSVVRSLRQDEINVLFDHLDVRVVAENMTLTLHKHEAGTPAGGGGAALIIQVKGLVPVEDEEIASTSNGVSPLMQRILLWRRPMVPITAILILLFIGSVILGISRQMGKKVHTDVARVLTDAQHAFDEGVALLELNPVKGRERLESARDELSPFKESLSPTSPEGKAVLKLYKDASDQLTVAMQIHRVQPTLFYDLSLLKASSTISSLGQNSDSLVLLDSTGPTIAALTLASKNGRVIAGGESYHGANLVALHGDNAFVLVPDGIHRASVRESKTTPFVVKKDEQWGSIASLVSYGGNLYLLDTSKSRIWKYVAAEKSFSETREYLNPDTLPDLSQGTGMAIDSGIWIGTRDGRILRFLQGKEETFASRGIEPSLGKMLVVATTEEDKNLYVLDNDNERVVVLDKDGVYLAQYVWTGNLAPTQLAVWEKLKLLLLLADGKLYSVELK